MNYRCRIETPLGGMCARAEEGALSGLWFEGQKYFPQDAEHWEEMPQSAVFDKLRAYLRAYFAGGQPGLDFPLRPVGTPFQRIVWDTLLEIPYGQVVTYAEVARRAADRTGRAPTSARAVGGAVGHNPISLLIPCHRVVGALGALTGYAAGLEKKAALLKLEGISFP